MCDFKSLNFHLVVLDALGFIDWVFRMRNEECRAFLGLQEVLDDTVGLVLDSSKEERRMMLMVERIYWSMDLNLKQTCLDARNLLKFGCISLTNLFCSKKCSSDRFCTEVVMLLGFTLLIALLSTLLSTLLDTFSVLGSTRLVPFKWTKVHSLFVQTLRECLQSVGW